MNPWKIIGWIVLAFFLLALTFCGLVCVRVANDIPPKSALTATPAPPSAPPAPYKSPENCNSTAKMAGTIMQARQAGMDMGKVLETSSSSEAFASKVRDLVVAAYESPRYSTEKNKARAVEDFRNDAYLACMKS